MLPKHQTSDCPAPLGKSTLIEKGVKRPQQMSRSVEPERNSRKSTISRGTERGRKRGRRKLLRPGATIRPCKKREERTRRAASREYCAQKDEWSESKSERERKRENGREQRCAAARKTSARREMKKDRKTPGAASRKERGGDRSLSRKKKMGRSKALPLYIYIYGCRSCLRLFVFVPRIVWGLARLDRDEVKKRKSKERKNEIGSTRGGIMGVKSAECHRLMIILASLMASSLVREKIVLLSRRLEWGFAVRAPGSSNRYSKAGFFSHPMISSFERCRETRPLVSCSWSVSGQRVAKKEILCRTGRGRLFVV